MNKTNRRILQLLARHSDWQPEEIESALQQRVHASATDWHWLLRMLFLALGFGFLASGILFFFAYNWSEIPKLGKIVIAALGVSAPVLLSLLPNLSDLLRKSFLTTGAFLVGPLFGVLGQIYQTGANAYDLFFAWALFIIIWAIVVDFAPLWLLFVGLLNITVSLYAEQIASGWDFSFTYMLLFALNSLAVVLVHLVPRLSFRKPYPSWLAKVFALAAIGCATVACFSAIMDEGGGLAGLYTLLVAIVYGLTRWYAIKQQELFYLVAMTFSLIVIGTAIIVQIDDNSGGFFLATLWVVGTTIGSIFYLNRYRKIWSHE
ncbi:DUF2157 domain-containing protein [Neolewinella persica]|uniref:DUF2157 domain-containing protein n=1 Tax=Neolewinella persica TaxID=70998 RepID=UPI0003616092|nr:DUF2157 domain-containing protein [Neolewinella persica]